MTYRHAPAVEQIAHELIKKYHDNLKRAPIVYRFKQGTMKSKGRVVGGKARVLSGLNAHLVGEVTALAGDIYQDNPMLLIEISEDWWYDDTTTEEARYALIDHELCHCDWSGVDLKAFIVPHDVEEFSDVIKRHGMWNTNVFDFAQVAAEQLALNLDGLADAG